MNLRLALPKPSRSFTNTYFLGILLGLAGIAAYSNSFRGVFLLDDYHVILENHAIRSLWPPRYLIGTRPFLNFTFAVDYALHGLHVWGYHAANLAIHILAALVLFALSRRTLEHTRTGFFASASQNVPPAQNSQTNLAFAIALLWVVHPLNTQAVTYIIQRSESLAGLFYLLTLYAVSRCVHSRGWKIAAVVSCALGMLTKETTASAPVAALFYDRMFLASSWREVVEKRWKLYLGLACTWGLLAITFINLSLPSTPKSAGFGVEHVAPLAYATTQPGVILHYLKLSIRPHPLCFDYAWPLVTNFNEAIFPIAAISALAILTIAGLRRAQPAAFPGLAFFLTLAPTSSFFPLLDPAAEHRMYLPLACLATLAVLGIRAAFNRFGFIKRLKFPVGFGLLMLTASLLGRMTYSRNSLYASAEQIWGDALKINPRNPRAHDAVSKKLAEEGKLEEAVVHHLAALRLNPNSAEALLNYGYTLTKQGKWDEAIDRYRKALLINPRFAKAHNNLGVTFAMKGNLGEAIREFSEALKIDPAYEEARQNLARAQSQAALFRIFGSKQIY